MMHMRPQDILLPVAAGLCCKPGGFHIDPVRPVERAVITHGHSDHARAGHGAVLATQETLDMMRLRYGENFAGSTQAIRYGEEIRQGDVTVTFHPAGHVLGSAQIAVSCKDTCIVASGDYKDARDPTCTPFELVPCDVFITEATFGLPVFRHGDAADEAKKLPAPSRSRRHRPPPISGRGASPTPSPRSPRAGCACVPARDSAASSYRW